ncbi:hypothetical protein C0Q70_18794 [Pomacea canaliculata]|uniref:Uncharacterized protein n=1 Tax=Pomacea canaliculata TaxID=400727 RepID=A0A2T7NHK5_POMCA|nr:hypothetical protein C0Q70_18794 [Pomacea canaliculata]
MEIPEDNGIVVWANSFCWMVAQDAAAWRWETCGCCRRPWSRECDPTSAQPLREANAILCISLRLPPPSIPPTLPLPTTLCVVGSLPLEEGGERCCCCLRSVRRWVSLCGRL